MVTDHVTAGNPRLCSMVLQYDRSECVVLREIGQLVGHLLALALGRAPVSGV